MQRKFIVKGYDVGTVVGCITGILYVWMIAIMLIHTADLFVHFGLGLLFSILALFPSGVIGAITGIVFGYLFQKFRTRKNLYIAVCGSLSTLAFIISLAIIVPLNWKQNLHLDNPDILFPLLCVLPGILYIFISFFASRYLFNKFKLIELEYRALLEKHADSASA